MVAQSTDNFAESGSSQTFTPSTSKAREILSDKARTCCLGESLLINEVLSRDDRGKKRTIDAIDCIPYEI
jgi:hypothetical protein